MRGIVAWLRGRKVTASVIASAVVLAVPVTFAVLHPGFPASDVDLQARDVWVTNGSDLLAGRINKQIEELDAAVSMQANDVDVFQNGDTVLLHDRASSTISTIDAAYTTLNDETDLPADAELAFGGSRLAVLDPEKGGLWITDVSGGLDFTTVDNPPLRRLGANSHVAVSRTGTVFAASPEKGMLYTFPSDGGAAEEQELPELSDFQLSAVGDQPVVFDEAGNEVIVPGTGEQKLPDEGVALQQASDDADEVLVAGRDSLMAVPLSGGDPTTIDAKMNAPAPKDTRVPAPVNLDGCWHAAWASGSRYLAKCGDDAPSYQDIKPTVSGAELVFRVNRDLIALNDMQSGDSWLVSQNMRLVHNWEEVTPPDDEEGEEGDEKSAVKSFEDTLADRTDQNRPPVAHDDDLGVRPGRSTVLEVLENDTDPDGDVLTVIDVKGFDDKWGTLEDIDGGRALQFTPDEELSAGTFSFRYTISDGRPGGVDEANVKVTIRPEDKNEPPESVRVGATAVDAGETITYNALADWRDPDGDDIYLTQASSEAGDRVRFRPDGEITVTHTSGQPGPRDINFTVSDGEASASGSFELDVKSSGSSDPVGTPDFAHTFVGEAVDVEPLENDLAPSGEQLTLLDAEALQGDVSLSVNSDDGTVTASAGKAGSYYVKYSLGAGERTSVGLIRIDVDEKDDSETGLIAVRDTGFVRPDQPTTIPVLANDVSPEGKVLAVKDVTAEGEASKLSIELLSQSRIRVTASADVSGQVQFEYTVSDGDKEATTTVTVVMLPPLTKHQAPSAEDDQVRVRAGDIASVPVLDNDTHPDEATMSVDEKLSETPDEGLAFVEGDQVRYQAPEKPGVYSAVYTVADEYGQSDTATVTFTVVGEDDGSNQAPTAKTLTTRVYAGSSVDINIPLDGLDPDGDSVVYDGIETAPAMGEVRNERSSSFTYEAGKTETGTDTFKYTIADVHGATAVGTIKIAVIPRPEQAMSPVAVDDTVEVQPGKVVSVPVLENDSDPNQYSFSLKDKLEDVPDDVNASVDGANVVVEAPEDETTFALRYTIQNEKGGVDSAYLMVRVTEDAEVQPPSAEDQIVEDDDAVGEKTVDIDPRDGATNPGGKVSALAVEVEGPNADMAKVLDNGTIRVTLADTRKAITFKLTNEQDELSARAFIVVPPYSKGKPPRLKEDLKEQVVPMNSTKEWSLDDIAYSPAGADISITGAEGVSASRSNGDSPYVDETTLRFTPKEDYRGPASITFEVTDGTKAGTTTLVMPVTVGDPDYKDVAPTFTSPKLTIEAGEDATTFDLRQASSHPNPDVVDQLTYSDLSGQGNSIEASLKGSKLSVSAPFGVTPGTSTTLSLTMSYKDFDVTATIDVTVVSSTRPMPRPVDHTNDDARKGETYTIDALKGAFNPFPDEDLRVVKAKLDSGDAEVDHDGRNVTVETGPAKSQEISVVYTVQDATQDPNRQASARITIVVKDVPDAPPAPKVSASDGKTTVVVEGSPASNGSKITSYTVVRSDGEEKTCSPGVACDMPAKNGRGYSFRVYATNGVGDSEMSPSSNKVTPYGKPSKPSAGTLRASSEWEGADLTLSWSAPDHDGGGITGYRWKLLDGNKKVDSGSTSGNATTAKVANVKAGTYRFQVRACNSHAGGDGCSAYSAKSGQVKVDDLPSTSLTFSKGEFRPESYTAYYYHLKVEGYVLQAGEHFTAVCHGPDRDTSKWEKKVTKERIADGTRDGKTRTLKLDSDGNFDGDINCYDGYNGQTKWLEVTIDGTTKTADGKYGDGWKKK